MKEPGIEVWDSSFSVLYFVLVHKLSEISGELSVVVAVGRLRKSVPSFHLWVFLTRIKEAVAF